MIGWWIIISEQTPEERDTASDKSAILANWECSVSGIRWLEQLSTKDQAAQLKKGGYPTRYVAFACDVLPLIANGPPKHDDMDIIGDDYVMPNGWSGNIIMNHEKIALCSPNTMLTIDVWDLD